MYIYFNTEYWPEHSFKMDIKITQNDIDRTYRIGKPKNNGKPSPTIIKFVR